MYSVFLAAFVNILVLVSAGETSGNTFKRPDGGDIVPVGKPYTITWAADTPGKVNLYLLRGPSNDLAKLATIVEGIDNTGTYTWTPPSTLEGDVTHYGLNLTVPGTDKFQYTMQFGISNPDKQAGSTPTQASSNTSGSANTATPSPTAKASFSAPEDEATSTALGFATSVMTTVYPFSNTTSQTTVASPSVSKGQGASTTQAKAASTTSAPAAKSSNGAVGQFEVRTAGGFMALAAAFMTFF